MTCASVRECPPTGLQSNRWPPAGKGLCRTRKGEGLEVDSDGPPARSAGEGAYDRRNFVCASVRECPPTLRAECLPGFELCEVVLGFFAEPCHHAVVVESVTPLS